MQLYNTAIARYYCPSLLSDFKLLYNFVPTVVGTDIDKNFLIYPFTFSGDITKPIAPSKVQASLDRKVYYNTIGATSGDIVYIANLAHSEASMANTLKES